MNTRLILAVLAAFVLSGCASIVSKSEYAVAINSRPDQANFTITNRAGQQVHSGVTPASITLKSSSGYFRSETYTITFEKQGYAAHSYVLNSGIDGWYFGNILLGGIIGMLIVDPITGAMYSLADRVDVALSPETAALDHPRDLVVASIDSLNQEHIDRLVPLN